MFKKEYPYAGESLQEIFNNIVKKNSELYSKTWIHSSYSYEFVTGMLESALVNRCTLKKSTMKEFISNKNGLRTSSFISMNDSKIDKEAEEILSKVFTDKNMYTFLFV